MKNSKVERIIYSLDTQKGLELIGKDCRYCVRSNQNIEEPSHITYDSLVFSKKDLVHLIKSTLHSKSKKLTEEIKGEYITEYIVWEDACPMTEKEPIKEDIKIRLYLDLNQNPPSFSAHSYFS